MKGIGTVETLRGCLKALPRPQEDLPTLLDRFFVEMGSEEYAEDEDFEVRADSVFDEPVPSYDDDLEGWVLYRYPIRIGRTNGRRFVSVDEVDVDDNHDLAALWEEGDDPQAESLDL